MCTLGPPLVGHPCSTPVYMSPELINSKNGKLGYDGRSVDVWASGILLLVMLLGSFPFDHTEHPDPNTSEAHLEVWLQQVSKRWSEVPHMAEAVKKVGVLWAGWDFGDLGAGWVGGWVGKGGGGVDSRMGQGAAAGCGVCALVQPGGGSPCDWFLLCVAGVTQLAQSPSSSMPAPLLAPLLPAAVPPVQGPPEPHLCDRRQEADHDRGH